MTTTLWISLVFLILVTGFYLVLVLWLAKALVSKVLEVMEGHPPGGH